MNDPTNQVEVYWSYLKVTLSNSYTFI